MNRYKVSETPKTAGVYHVKCVALSAGVYHVHRRIGGPLHRENRYQTNSVAVYSYDRYTPRWWSCEEDGAHIPWQATRAPCEHIRAVMEAQRC